MSWLCVLTSHLQLCQTCCGQMDKLVTTLHKQMLRGGNNIMCSIIHWGGDKECARQNLCNCTPQDVIGPGFWVHWLLPPSLNRLFSCNCGVSVTTDLVHIAVLSDRNSKLPCGMQVQWESHHHSVSQKPIFDFGLRADGSSCLQIDPCTGMSAKPARLTPARACLPNQLVLHIQLAQSAGSLNNFCMFFSESPN